MILLCLDQSSKISGFSVWDFEKNKLIDYGYFSLPDIEIGKRLYKLREKVIELINKFTPDKIYLENIQLQEGLPYGVTTYKVLSAVLGVIVELCCELQIPCELVYSQTWKSRLNIKGRTRKEQKNNAKAYVEQKHKIEISTQDVADAICIGEFAMEKEKADDECAW